MRQWQQKQELLGYRLKRAGEGRATSVEGADRSRSEPDCDEGAFKAIRRQARSAETDGRVRRLEKGQKQAVARDSGFR